LTLHPRRQTSATERKRIADLFYNGHLTVEAIAELFCLTESQIRRICHEMRPRTGSRKKLIALARNWSLDHSHPAVRR